MLACPSGTGATGELRHESGGEERPRAIEQQPTRCEGGRRGRGSVTILLKLDMPKKVSKSLRKSLDSLKDEIGTDFDSLEDSMRDEAQRRRRG